MFLTGQIRDMNSLHPIMCFPAEDQTGGKNSPKQEGSEDGCSPGLPEQHERRYKVLPVVAGRSAQTLTANDFTPQMKGDDLFLSMNSVL